MFRRPSLLFIAFQVFTLSASAYPGQLGWAKYIWNEIEWTYSGSLNTTGIENGGADWNSYVGYRITINPSGFSEDIQISDDEGLPQDVLAQTQMFSQAYDSGCYLKYNDSNYYICLNASVAFYAAIQMHPSAITADAAAAGWTVDQDVEVTTSHEFGHVLDLDDDMGIGTCYSPTIMNYDDPYPSMCNFLGPQQCDVSEMLSAYSTWTVITWEPAECFGSCN